MKHACLLTTSPGFLPVSPPPRGLTTKPSHSVVRFRVLGEHVPRREGEGCSKKAQVSVDAAEGERP